MRAIYHPFENLEKTLLITGEQAKHLQVVRIRQGEEVLLLNGQGAKAYTVVGAISKNQVELIVSKVESETRMHGIHLAVANPKKDAFEDILKIAVEMGVKSIQPLKSEYSQYDYESSDRLNRILESALIQSNNAFMPVVHTQKSLEEFLESIQLPLYFFNSRPSENKITNSSAVEKMVLIGPEGGFSEREIDLITARPQIFSIHLPTPIQRAPTAVASSIGYLLAQGVPSSARS